MSRRASLFAKQNPEGKKPKGVRFSDELVFLDNIKENDIKALDHMLRRASLQVDISGINDAGRSMAVMTTGACLLSLFITSLYICYIFSEKTIVYMSLKVPQLYV